MTLEQVRQILLETFDTIVEFFPRTQRSTKNGKVAEQIFLWGDGKEIGRGLNLWLTIPEIGGCGIEISAMDNGKTGVYFPPIKVAPDQAVRIMKILAESRD